VRRAAHSGVTRSALYRAPLPVVSREEVRTEPELLRASRAPSGATPYVDYGRWLTPEGGIAITYKDVDSRFRYTLRRLILWLSVTGVEAWLLQRHSPVHSLWINLGILLLAAIINWLIVRRPVEVMRTIEIRPDCIIIDGVDLFWRHLMEGGFPSFHANEKGHQVLGGIYGTRYVEYLSVRSFDKHDRTPSVLAAHVQEAMRQLWSWPQ